MDDQVWLPRLGLIYGWTATHTERRVTLVTLNRGQRVKVKTAFGDYREKRAVTGKLRGESFYVVYLCSDEEWNKAIQESREPISSPWPAEDIEVMAPA